jgi:hypothetical protein
VRPFDIEHADPVSRARTAAINSRAEQDPRTREAARAMTPEERLRAAIRLSREASRIRRVV